MYLLASTELNNRYVIEDVLGHGGFGVTYAAIDKVLNVKVAIKEYLPRQAATRAEGQTKVSIFTGESGKHYAIGLKKFLEEAQSIAQFGHHPNIVSARDYFEANNTAYMVMEYIEGVTLKQYLEKKGGKIPFEAAKAIMMPVMDALREVHSAGLLHRDISPDNIYLTSTGQVKVLDFGAARYYAGEQGKSLSVILKAGYAPEEQYRSNGRQGTWTDVYATGATMYRLISGKIPPCALDRKEEDTLEPPSQLGISIPTYAEKAILRALAVNAVQRFQTIGEFQAALDNGRQVVEPTATSTIVEPFRERPLDLPREPRNKKPKSKTLIFISGGAVGLALLGSLLWIILSPSGGKKPVIKSPPEAAAKQETLPPAPMARPQEEQKAKPNATWVEREVAMPASPPAYSPSVPPATPQATWGGRWPWTSGRIIREDELQSLSLAELELMRNEIFARHGWIFNRKDLRDYFAGQGWYRPKGDPSTRELSNRLVQSELSSIEKKNIQMIVSREKALKR